MFIDKKPFVYLWQPIYRMVFAGIVWPFLTRVKAFFFAETGAEIATIEQRLGALEAQNNILIARIASMEDEQRKHWDNVSKLLLCLFQQPQPHPTVRADDVSRRDECAMSRTSAS